MQPTRKARAIADMNPNGPPQTDRIFVVRKGEATPVWRVRFRSGDPVGDWEVFVNAADGSIISRQNLRKGADTLGYAFPRNPLKGDLERVALHNLVSDKYLLSAQTKIYTVFPALRGQVEPNTVDTESRAEGKFLYNLDDARFSEVQLYWGMETASARFARLGFWGFDEPLAGTVLWQDFDATQKKFVGKDNAFFTPFGFGDRGGMFLSNKPEWRHIAGHGRHIPRIHPRRDQRIGRNRSGVHFWSFERRVGRLLLQQFPRRPCYGRVRREDLQFPYRLPSPN